MLPHSGDRLRSPPPHAPYSFLSSSAAPFTIDRTHAPDPIPNPNPSPYPNLPTAPSIYDSWVDPRASYMAAAATSASAPPGYTGVANSDGLLVSESASHDLYSGNCFISSDLHPFMSDSLEWIEGEYPRIYRESSEALSSGFTSSVCHQHSLIPNILGCLDREPHPMPQAVNHYPACSAYDNHMSVLPSCSTDPLTHNLSMPSVAASPELCGLAKRVKSAMDDTVLESSFSFPPYMNPCRINLDYFDFMRNEPQDLVGYQTVDKHYGDWSNSASGMRIMGNYPLSSLRENYNVGENLGSGMPVQPSPEVKSDLINLQEACSKVSPSDIGFAQPHELFSESLEVNNPVVDSPCWKGTPAAHQASFGFVKNNDTPCSANGTGDCHDSHQSIKLSEFNTRYSGLFSDHHEASTSENDPSLPCINYISNLRLPVECKRSEDHKEIHPVGVGTCNDMARHASCMSKERCTEREKLMNYNLGENSRNVIHSGQQESVYPVNKTSESQVSGENIGSHVGSMSEEPSKKVLSHIGAAPKAHAKSLTKESLQGNTLYVCEAAAAAQENMCFEMHRNRAHEHLSYCNLGIDEHVVKVSSDKAAPSPKMQAEFIKSIHQLTIMLLSTCNGGNALEESEQGLLQSVIQNLNSLTPRRSKTELKAHDAISNSSPTKLEGCVGKTCQPEKSADLVPENIGTDFKIFTLQALAKLPEESTFSHTKDAQMSVYKNLWIEAEASVCKLKYELQLARMELAMTGHDQQKDVVPTDSTRNKASSLTLSKNLSCIDHSKPQSHVKESNISSATMLPHGVDSGDRQSPEINRCTTDGVDANVFARLDILKARDDNIYSFYEGSSEHQHEASKKKADEVDDVVKARLGALRSSDDSSSSIVDDIIKQQLEASNNKADEADDTVLANVSDFKCSNDDISSLGEDNSNQHQAASNKESDGVEDDVMARLHILKGRIDNTTSGVEGSSSLSHSGDLAGHLEREETGSAVQSGTNCGLIEEANLPNGYLPNALSDEAESKPAVQHLNASQYEDGFANNFTCPQAVGMSDVFVALSPTMNMHYEQQSYSPLGLGWEHVLKEDFFHPGNPLK